MSSSSSAAAVAAAAAAAAAVAPMPMRPEQDQHPASLSKYANKQELQRKIQQLSRQQQQEEELLVAAAGQPGRMDDCTAAMVLMYLSQVTGDPSPSAPCPVREAPAAINPSGLTTSSPSGAANKQAAMNLCNNTIAKQQQHQQAARQHQLRFIMNQVNPVKTRTIFSCMWPDCSKNCDALDDIERHVRSHLGPKCDAIGDEDFYYEETEVDEATYLAIFSRTNTLPMSPSHNSDGLSSGQSFASSSPATSPVCSTDSSSSAQSSASSASSTSSALSSSSSTSAYPATSAAHHHYANSIDWGHFLAEHGQLVRGSPSGQAKWLPSGVFGNLRAGQAASGRAQHPSPGRPRCFGKRTRNLSLKGSRFDLDEGIYEHHLLLEDNMELGDEEDRECEEEEGERDADGQLQFYMELDNPAPGSSSPSSPTSSGACGARSPPSLPAAAASVESPRQQLPYGRQPISMDPLPADAQANEQRKQPQDTTKHYLAKQQLLDHTYTNCSPPSGRESPASRLVVAKTIEPSSVGLPELAAHPSASPEAPTENSLRKNGSAGGTLPLSTQAARGAKKAAAVNVVAKRGPGRRPKPEGYHLGLIVNGSGGCYQRHPKASSHSSPNSNSSPSPSQSKSASSAASKQIDGRSNATPMQANNSGQIVANHHNHLKHNLNKQFFHNQPTSSQRNNYNSVNNHNYLKGLSRSGGSPSGGPTHSLGSPGAGGPGHVKRPRGENRKCRKVYGMERRDLWCIQCKWKKACSRYLL